MLDSRNLEWLKIEKSWDPFDPAGGTGSDKAMFLYQIVSCIVLMAFNETCYCCWMYSFNGLVRSVERKQGKLLNENIPHWELMCSLVSWAEDNIEAGFQLVTLVSNSYLSRSLYFLGIFGPCRYERLKWDMLETLCWRTLGTAPSFWCKWESFDP